MFVPRGASPDRNRVHVFFGPRDAALDVGGNDVTVQGLRSAAEPTDWILIGVSGIVGGWRTIDDQTIAACLARAGRSTTVSEYRVSGHSRGVAGMRETLGRRRLGTAPVGRIFVLDAGDIYRGPARNTLVYKVNVATGVPGATEKVFNSLCMRAIGYSRLIQNASVTNANLVVPSAVRAQLLTLPARGCFAFMSRPGSGCLVDVGRFCASNQRAIARIIANETTADGLHTFIHANNLFRDPQRYQPGIYSHHLFVAEMAHELFAP
jgi:hypothetical protein